MKILFLNQYAPPDSPPTASLLDDLSEFLKARGHEVEIVSAAVKYGEREHEDRKRGKNELQALLRILWRGLCALRPDVVVAFSSPPCLLVIATIIARRHRARLIHWALDLYPDLAIALGVLNEGPLARLLRRLMRWGYHQADRVVTLDADMQSFLEKNYEVRASILAPWPPEIAWKSAPVAESRGLWRWLYSGNLGRAHEWKALLQAQALIEQRQLPIQLVFQGGGQAWAEGQQYAAGLGLKNCLWRDYADEKGLAASLEAAGALIITQRPEVRGMLWPSKLALCLLSGKPLLWVGPTDGATAQALHAASGLNHGVFAADNVNGIADWVEKTRYQSSTGKMNVDFIERQRTKNLEQWLEWINSAHA